MASCTSLLNFAPHHASALILADLPTVTAYTAWTGISNRWLTLILLRHSIAQTIIRGTGISTCCPSPTPFGLALGPDLPRADQPSPGNLRLFGLEGFSPSSRYSFRHSHFYAVHRSLRSRFIPHDNAPLPITLRNSLASVSCFSPGHFRRRTSRPVSYYALFE